MLLTPSESVATIGVGLLLMAFLLNLGGRLPHDSRSYQVMNAVGAGLACVASCMIPFFPFVILEGLWCAVAVYALIRGYPEPPPA